MTREVLLHGVPFAWSNEGAPVDPLPDLLALIDPPPATDASAAAPAAKRPPTAIHFRLRPADPRPADPREDGWEPSFYLGIIQAYRRPGAFLLDDRGSRVLLPDAGAPCEAYLAPPEREALPGLTAVTMQLALCLALRSSGLFHMHAGAAQLRSGAGVLIVGGSGAGKTTTTLALLEAGAAWISDDAVFLRDTGAAGVELLGFPRPFHLGAATRGAFPRLAALVGPTCADADKRPLDPRAAFARRAPWPSDGAFPAHPDGGVLAGPGAPLLAIFPRIADAATTEIAPLARAEAFGYLVASSAAVVIDDIVGRDENLAVLRATLGHARCYELAIGRDALVDPAGAIASRIAALV